jgi:hypothetical protein
MLEHQHPAVTLSYWSDGRRIFLRFPAGVCVFFLFSKWFRPASGSSKTLIKLVPGSLSSGIRRPRREVDLSTARSPQSKNDWSFTSTSLICFHDMDRYDCTFAGVFTYIAERDQPRGLVVRVSDYWSWGTGFDSRFCHGDFPLKGKIPMATMV